MASRVEAWLGLLMMVVLPALVFSYGCEGDDDYCQGDGQDQCEFWSHNGKGCYWVDPPPNPILEAAKTPTGIKIIMICLCLCCTCCCSMTEFCTHEHEKQMLDKAAKLKTPAGKIIFIKDIVFLISSTILAVVGIKSAHDEMEITGGGGSSAKRDIIFGLEVLWLASLQDIVSQAFIINGWRVPILLNTGMQFMILLWLPYAIYVLFTTFEDSIGAYWYCLLFGVIMLCGTCVSESFIEGCLEGFTGTPTATAQGPQQQPLLTAPQTVLQLPQPVDRRGTRWPPFDLSPIPAPPSFWKNRDLSKNFDERCEVSAKTRAKIETLVNSTFKTTRTRDRKGKMVSGLRVVKVQRIEDALMYVNYQVEKMKMKQRRGQCTKIKDISPGGRVKTVGFSGSSGFFGDGQLSPELNECYLFHGTSPGGATGISEDGFRLNLAGSHRGSMFGDGAYLAECSSKSDEYASDDKGSIYQDIYALVLCRALCGEMFYTEEPGNFQAKFPPQYDSVLGDREKAANTYREFVFFNKWQIYPEFVVLYERCYD